MIHKGLIDGRMNLINYMSAPMTGHSYLGFIRIGDDEYWGTGSGEHSFAACHLLDTPTKKFRSDEEIKEQKLIDSGRHVVLYLKGNDNTSYLKRFLTKDAAIKWYYKTEIFTPDDKSCWVNS